MLSYFVSVPEHASSQHLFTSTTIARNYIAVAVWRSLHNKCIKTRHMVYQNNSYHSVSKHLESVLDKSRVT